MIDAKSNILGAVIYSNLSWHRTSTFPSLSRDQYKWRRNQKKLIRTKFLKKVLMQKQSMYMMGIYEVGAINNGMPTKITKPYVLVSRTMLRQS